MTGVEKVLVALPGQLQQLAFRYMLGGIPVNVFEEMNREPTPGSLFSQVWKVWVAIFPVLACRGCVRESQIWTGRPITAASLEHADVREMFKCIQLLVGCAAMEELDHAPGLRHAARVKVRLRSTWEGPEFVRFADFGRQKHYWRRSKVRQLDIKSRHDQPPQPPCEGRGLEHFHS